MPLAPEATAVRAAPIMELQTTSPTDVTADDAGLTPRRIVSELDKYVVGQNAAKKAVAVALRNRWRRLRAPEDMRDEITPANIILIGPTGVGKTEIARRLAKLTGAPFVKVEATKFTEVGYVGRDVESMIRDLVDLAIAQAKDIQAERVTDQARVHAENRLLDLLLPSSKAKPPAGLPGLGFPVTTPSPAAEETGRSRRQDPRAVPRDAPPRQPGRPRGRGRRVAGQDHQPPDVRPDGHGGDGH